MKTLKDPSRLVVACLGTQIFDTNVNYVWSPYIVREGDAVFNALTDEAVLLEGNETEYDLIRRWMLIPETIDVRTLMYSIKQRRLYETTGPGSQLKTFYTIFTTTDCNASCPYCFEKGCEIKTMTDATANDVASYIIRSRSKSKTTGIKWFGGEPLCNKNAINIISKKLIENNVDFHSEITSNGDLFDTCTDEELKDIWHVKSVQFTVDDAGKNYDLIKGLPDGAYERLKKSVERLWKLRIRVHLRLHYNPNVGLDACRKVIQDFKQYPNLTMYVRLVFHNDSVEHYKELIEIESEIEAAGKRTYGFPKYSVGNHCMADSTRMVSITPDGRFTPCEHYSSGENIYGSIYSREKRQDILDKWAAREKYEMSTCRECPLFPSCRKLVMCPAEGKCSDGYQYYQIETVKRALRKKVEEINGRN